MGRKLHALTLVVLGAMAWSAVGSGAAEETGRAIIRVTDREVVVKRVDLGPRGVTPGDMEIVRTLLYNTRITSRSIGHSELVCTVTVGLSRVCRGTFFLPRGRIVVGGSLRYRALFELAVLGGTGLYDNARGSLTVTRIARKPNRAVVRFELVG